MAKLERTKNATRNIIFGVILEDEEGFEYPQIEESKCVRCYQCIKVCPIKAARAQ